MKDNPLPMLNSTDLAGLQLCAINLRRKFRVTERKPWTATASAMELMVQVGHLASVLLESSTAYPTLADEVREEGRNFDNFGDELADCLLHGLTLTAYLSWMIHNLIYHLCLAVGQQMQTLAYYIKLLS
jgi:hypothetical protein